MLHDKYDVIANLMLATEKVRRREQKERPSLKDPRWPFRKNPENLNEEQQTELAVLTPINLATVKGYLIRVGVPERLPAVEFQCCPASGCRWLDPEVRAFEAVFGELMKFGDSAEQHLGVILAYRQ